MFTSDAISYIPLFCTAAVSVLIGILLTIIKVRRTAKVSFIAYFALALIIFACVYTASHPGMMLFSLLLLLSSLLFIPYCIMLAFGKPKEKENRERIPFFPSRSFPGNSGPAEDRGALWCNFLKKQFLFSKTKENSWIFRMEYAILIVC